MKTNVTTITARGNDGILSYRALPVLVEVDGLPAPWLDVVDIIRSTGAKGITGRFRVLPHAWGVTSRFEEIATIVQPGQQITVRMFASRGIVPVDQITWPVFAGVVCRGQASIASASEDVEIVACDNLSYQNTHAINGMRVVGTLAENIFIPTSQVVFNPDGEPNASRMEYDIAGKQYRVFELSELKAVYWTYASALTYLAAEGLALSMYDKGSLASLEKLTEGQVLRDVEVTGLTPLAAMERLCDRAGLGFCIAQVPVGERDVKDVLQFYRRGEGRRTFLRHQRAGERLEVAKTNVAQCSLKTNRPAETIRVIGRGASKRFEATFDLVGGWDPNLEENNYDLYSSATNPNFRAVRDVFRKWVLNEAGDYTGEPYNRGAAYDFRSVFGNANYNAHRRRFYPCLSANVMGKSLGYYLEISYDGGDTWQEYAGAFDHLLDECGVYLNSSQMDLLMWYAIKKELLRFRITATVEADESLEAYVYDGPQKSMRPVRTYVVELGQEFQYRQVTGASIFYKAVGEELGQPDECDDRESMRGLLRDRLKQLRQERLTGTARLAWIQPNLWPGDIVTGMQGRELDFAQLAGMHGRDSRGTSIRNHEVQVRQVKMIWDDLWSTEIEFE
jgi:hypothetical protein